MEFDEFDPNIRRKINGENYDLQKDLRMAPKTKERAGKFEVMKKDLKKRTGRDGNQAVLEYILALGWEKFEELERNPQDDLDQLARTRS